jgi:hypothetical protein
VPLAGGGHEGALAETGTDIDVGEALLDEDLDDAGVAAGTGVVEGGPAVLVLVVDVGATGDEDLDDGEVTMVGCLEEGGLSSGEMSE